VPAHPICVGCFAREANTVTTSERSGQRVSQSTCVSSLFNSQPPEKMPYRMLTMTSETELFLCEMLVSILPQTRCHRHSHRQHQPNGSRCSGNCYQENVDWTKSIREVIPHDTPNHTRCIDDGNLYGCQYRDNM
jgi:hypothetical protein